MPCAAVARCLSVTTAPRLFTRTPALSRPSRSVTGVRPAAISRCEAATWEASPWRRRTPRSFGHDFFCPGTGVDRDALGGEDLADDLSRGRVGSGQQPRRGLHHGDLDAVTLEH